MGSRSTWTSGFSDSVTVASATHLHLQVAPAAASVAVAVAAVEAAVSDVIRNPCHFSIAFVFAYNRE